MQLLSLPPAPKLTNETAIALEAARIGGSVLLGYWEKIGTSDIREKGKGDLVTAADLASEQAITDFLAREYPAAAIVSEEGTERGGDGPVWYVDPLDGTTNFVQRFPVFAVSIGLVSSPDRTFPDLSCGVVLNPVSRELFCGAAGKGSYLNGTRMHVSAKSLFGDAVVATGFPRRYADELPSYLAEFAVIYPRCRAVRRAGAAALDLCWTAQGVFDCFWEHRLSPWDIAAGALIVQEAGGSLTDFEGGRSFLQSGNIAAGSPPIHAILLDCIRQAKGNPRT